MTITNHGHPVALLSPMPPRQRKFGQLQPSRRQAKRHSDISRWSSRTSANRISFGNLRIRRHRERPHRSTSRSYEHSRHPGRLRPDTPPPASGIGMRVALAEIQPRSHLAIHERPLVAARAMSFAHSAHPPCDGLLRSALAARHLRRGSKPAQQSAIRHSDAFYPGDGTSTVQPHSVFRSWIVHYP